MFVEDSKDSKYYLSQINISLWWYILRKGTERYKKETL